ncbi:PIN-like domain-containing protein [Mesorhizobium sp. L-2-11]|uniref:PIN-like domain-containing protein n=1 Tax=Mesorhizobium sp. L-2-11 TaxID=2744521 RepID=UPI001926015D|nr:PIN-like domain-containing protein [Mesorhizobium sp. L-2-11]BCH13687.1 hypothetical protein MesoLjLa_05380 [Mesorhizobium sp. L-2-11]
MGSLWVWVRGNPLHIRQNLRALVEALLRQKGESFSTENRIGRRRQTAPSAALQLPRQAEDIEAFAVRADSLLRATKTRVYVDTSLLMWMIRIGSTARREFVTWLDDACGQRVRVPAWASHELYRHHIKRKICIDLQKQLTELENVAKASFDVLWPFLDEPLAGSPSAHAQRVEARDTLRAVRTLTARAADWEQNYDRHAGEVISFVNEHALEGSAIFEYFNDIDVMAAARFTGRMPPGFQDRNKKESTGESEENDADESVGSNRWGDLMLWREIVEDARLYRADAVVLLTKDIKNDWRMGGTLPLSVATEENPKQHRIGAQPAHPMLSFEAARRAGVREVLLLDQRRLAGVMSASAPSTTTAFVTVARPPALPPPKSRDEHRAEEIERQTALRDTLRTSQAHAAGVRFLDPPGVTLTPAKLKRALFETRDAGAMLDPALLSLEAALAQSLQHDQGIEVVISEDHLRPLTDVGLVAFARRLGQAARRDSSRSTATMDLATMLESLPPAVGGYIYFGLLAAMYFGETDNNLRTIPGSPAAQRLLSLQTAPFARLPLEELRIRAMKGERLPLYLPTANPVSVAVRLRTDTDLEQPNVLRAIWIGDQQILTGAQGDHDLQLQHRFAGHSATLDLILDHLADLYVLPRGQLMAETDVEGPFNLDPLLGFKPPQDVWVDPTQEKN